MNKRVLINLKLFKKQFSPDVPTFTDKQILESSVKLLQDEMNKILIFVFLNSFFLDLNEKLCFLMLRPYAANTE